MSVVHFPSEPVQVLVGSSRIPLDTLVRTRCNSLFSNFKPPWWLCNGHLQTIYGELSGPAKAPHLWYRRQYLELQDGGTIGLDFLPLDWSSFGDDVPIVVVLPGLSGGSHAPYVRSLIAPICDPVEKGGLGYRAIVINPRGLAGVRVTSPMLTAAGGTDDLRQSLWYIAHEFPRARLLGVGFSIGANKITRYLAEEGSSSLIFSACIMSNPWNLDENGVSLQASKIRNFIYGRSMGRNQAMLLQLHRKALTTGSSSDMLEAFQRGIRLKDPTIIEFDDAFTRFVGGSSPPYPFASVSEYYLSNSSHDALPYIRVPFCSIDALDDPMVRHVPENGTNNPFVVMVRTRRGGHLAWYENSSEKWTTKPVLEWLKVFGEEVNSFGGTDLKRPTFHLDSKGYIRTVQSGLGCRLSETSEIFSENTNWPWPHLLGDL